MKMIINNIEKQCVNTDAALGKHVYVYNVAKTWRQWICERRVFDCNRKKIQMDYFNVDNNFEPLKEMVIP